MAKVRKKKKKVIKKKVIKKKGTRTGAKKKSSGRKPPPQKKAGGGSALEDAMLDALKPPEEKSVMQDWTPRDLTAYSARIVMTPDGTCQIGEVFRIGDPSCSSLHNKADRVAFLGLISKMKKFRLMVVN